VVCNAMGNTSWHRQRMGGWWPPVLMALGGVGAHHLKAFPFRKGDGTAPEPLLAEADLHAERRLRRGKVHEREAVPLAGHYLEALHGGVLLDAVPQGALGHVRGDVPNVQAPGGVRQEAAPGSGVPGQVAGGQR